MRWPSTLIIALALLGPGAVAADELGLDIGRGNHNSRGANGTFVRYARDAFSWEGFPGYWEVAGGAWYNDYQNEVISVMAGLRYPASAAWRFSAGVGAAYVDERTEHLGTHLQFALRLAIGYRLGQYEISLARYHYSNGKGLFRWDGPNVGENFLTIGVARQL